MSKIEKAKILVCKIRKVRSELRKWGVDEDDRKERGILAKKTIATSKGNRESFLF